MNSGITSIVINLNKKKLMITAELFTCLSTRHLRRQVIQKMIAVVYRVEFLQIIVNSMILHHSYADSYHDSGDFDHSDDDSDRSSVHSVK